MNWKLIQPSEGWPDVDEWGPRPLFHRENILDWMYEDLQRRGETEGIRKLGPGAYLVEGGWV